MKLPALRAKRIEQVKTIISEMTDANVAAEKIVDLMELEKPSLGRVTTVELIDELSARAEIGGYANYRTIDND